MIKKENYIICMIIITFQWINGQDPPFEFEYSQSTLQAFYFFTDVTLNGEPIELDDWVAAFKGDVCVGTRQWDTSGCLGGMCDVPVMGDDGSEYSVGYMDPGDIPTFKIYDTSSSTVYDAVPSGVVGSWSVSGFLMNDLLETNADILGCMEIDACNYDPYAVSASDCYYEFDCLGECGGSTIEDCAGECGGSAIEDCAGECGGTAVDAGCGCGEPGPSGCDNACGSTAEDLGCGCGEPGIAEGACDCTGNVDAGCGCGEAGPSGCDNVCGSTAEDLGCGCGEPGPSGCDNACGSTAEDLGCGCGEPGIAEGTCDCAGSVVDCAGECGGSAVLDECGDCDGDGPPCLGLSVSAINSFSISNIYPNPFNPVVNIDLEIDIVGHLQLSVFTLEGTEIMTIYNGPSTVGESTFTWRPQNRASGFYFINAVIGNQVKTQKVLFLK